MYVEQMINAKTQGTQYYQGIIYRKWVTLPHKHTHTQDTRTTPTSRRA